MGKTVYELVADTFNKLPDEITDDLCFGSIVEWDSLGHIALMVSLEREFKLEITQDRIAQLVSIRAIRALIEDQAACTAEPGEPRS